MAELNSMTKVKNRNSTFLLNTLLQDFLKIKHLRSINGVWVQNLPIML